MENVKPPENDPNSPEGKKTLARAARAITYRNAVVTGCLYTEKDVMVAMAELEVMHERNPEIYEAILNAEIQGAFHANRLEDDDPPLLVILERVLQEAEITEMQFHAVLRKEQLTETEYRTKYTSAINDLCKGISRKAFEQTWLRQLDEEQPLLGEEAAERVRHRIEAWKQRLFFYAEIEAEVEEFPFAE